MSDPYVEKLEGMLDAERKVVKALEGARHVHSFAFGETPVSMMTFEGRLYVATNHRIYELTRGKLRPIEAVYSPGEPRQ